MTARLAQVVVGAVSVALLAWCAFGGHVPILRTAHARPAARDFSGTVMVTAEGELFHEPGCPFIHGPGRTLDAADAEREGYTPCPRCLARAFQQAKR